MNNFAVELRDKVNEVSARVLSQLVAVEHSYQNLVDAFEDYKADFSGLLEVLEEFVGTMKEEMQGEE